MASKNIDSRATQEHEFTKFSFMLCCTSLKLFVVVMTRLAIVSMDIELLVELLEASNVLLKVFD